MLLTATIRPLRTSIFYRRPPPTWRRKMSTSSSPTLDSYLVTPSQLNTALRKNARSRISTAPRIIPLCAAWFLPNDPEQRNGFSVFQQRRIPHARFFDLDEVKDPHSPYPHMLPSASDFASAMSRLGVRGDDSLVVYDTAELGIFSAPRVAWTLKIFGHPNVHILNNFKIWVDEGYPVETGEYKDDWSVTSYPTPQLDESKVASFEEVKDIAKEQGKEGAEEIQILDARSEGRFKGVDPEPRPGLPSGHIPYSHSFPVPLFLDPKTKAFKAPDELKKVFEERGITVDKPVISSCGTGVTATVIDTALTEAGFPEQGRRVYDGSWTEWAQRVKPNEGLIVSEDK